MNTFAVDYAPTSRARCQGCKKPIAKGSLRMIKISPNPFSGDSADMMERYYHPSHLFESFKRVRKGTRIIHSEADIRDFQKIKPSDQERIRKLIRGPSRKKTYTEYRVITEEITTSSEDSCSDDFDSESESDDDDDTSTEEEVIIVQEEETDFTGIQAEYDSWEAFDQENEFPKCYIMLSGTGWCTPCAVEHKKFAKSTTDVPKVVIHMPETGIGWSAHGLVVKSVPKFIFKSSKSFKSLGSHWKPQP